MDKTPNLNLPFIIASQAQKHVTHNEAIRALDALVQIAVETRGLSVPPEAPIEGSRYIVGENATEEWAGHKGAVAAFQDGTWTFFNPQIGWLAWVIDDVEIVVWNDDAWSPITPNIGGAGSAEATLLWGVNAIANNNTRLSVSSSGSLFNHEGSDHRLKVNKSSPADTASIVFQDGFSGQAECGLMGDNHWRVKVSGGSNTWLDAIVVDSTTGAVSLPNTPSQSGQSGQSGFLPTYFLGFSNDADTAYLEGQRLSLSFDESGGGVDSHNGFDSTTNVYTVAEAGLYQCVIVVNLKSVPAVGRGGIHMARSQDNGETWVNVFKAMANSAASVFGSNIAFMNFATGDKVALHCNAPSGGVAEFWPNTRLAITRIA